jgi:hypothetical protein
MKQCWRSIFLLMLLAGLVESCLPRHGWWLARIALQYEAQRTCQLVHSRFPPTSTTAQAEFQLVAVEGNLVTAQWIRTSQHGDEFLWQFWRDNTLLVTWRLKAADEGSKGSWYSGEVLEIVAVRQHRSKNTAAPLRVYDFGATYPNLRCLLLVDTEGTITGCIVAIWKT